MNVREGFQNIFHLSFGIFHLTFAATDSFQRTPSSMIVNVVMSRRILPMTIERCQMTNGK
jgi:hypothetical protein